MLSLEAVLLTNILFSILPHTVNFVFQEMGIRTYKCYIYTPANLCSYGLVVKEEEVFFKVHTAYQYSSMLKYTQSDY